MLFLGVLVGVAGCVAHASQAEANRQGSIHFDVLDPRPVIEHDIDDSLVLRAIRRPGLGWDIEVVKDSTADSPNLLYHSAEWHGPYPCQIYAWSFAERYFPDARELDVRGFPYVVRIRLVGCKTNGAGAAARFTGGEIDVSWQPEKRPAGESTS